MALTISVGFVVDDAIVMIENIVRHMEKGVPPLQAALVGSRQIGFTVLSISISLVAVFIPLIFMGGILGRLFHEFAMTMTLAIAISAVGVAVADADAVRPLYAGARTPARADLGPARRARWRPPSAAACASMRARSAGRCGTGCSCCW